MAKEHLVPSVENSLIHPETIAELAEEALRKGISFADNVATGDVLGRTYNELTLENEPSDKGFAARAQLRVKNSLEQRGNIHIPIVLPNEGGKWVVKEGVRVPTPAHIFEDLHNGLIQVVPRPSTRIKLEVDTLYYDSMHFPQGKKYAIEPHADDYKYFQALLTIYGSAMFYYPRYDVNFIHDKFYGEALKREVTAGTLVVIRGMSMKRFGYPMTHAVSPPTNEDGQRLVLGLGYL